MATVTRSFTTVGTTNWTVPAAASLVSLFIVGGGGSGAGGNTSGGGGGGGQGGRVQQYNNISVTPGSTISVVVGAGGAAVAGGAAGNAGGQSSFGVYTAAGGVGGTARLTLGGDGGGGSAGSGSAPSGSTGGNGGIGILFRDVVYGAGGGGGCGTFDRNSVFPVRGGESPGPGTPGAGDGASDSVSAQAGTSNTGRGGGGGRSPGETTRRSDNPVQNPNPAATWISVGAGGGAAGGSGIVIVTYEETEYNLNLLRDNVDSASSGFAEAGTVTIQLKTSNIANGTVVPFTLSGTGISAADFSLATLSGSFTVSSTDGGKTGSASVTLTLAADVAAEGLESATLTLNNGRASITFNIGDFSKPALTDVDGLVIRASDYNNIRNKIINILGSGSSSYGYGQLVKSAAVDETSRVRVLDWSNLRYDIINVWKHQFGTTASLANVFNNNEANGDGNIVRANSTNAPYDQYDNIVNILTANRFGIHSSQAVTRTGPEPETPWIKQYTGSWTTKLACTVTVSWTTATAARYFFNTGGEIRFTSARTEGTLPLSPQNTSWTTLLTGAGAISFGGNMPGQGISGTDAQNYFRLTSTPTVWSTRTASSPYGSNTYTIKASSPDPSGSAKTIVFLVEWTDGHIGTDGSLDTVDGTMSLAVTTLEASGNFEPAGSGTFSVQSPTITLTDITLS